MASLPKFNSASHGAELVTADLPDSAYDPADPLHQTLVAPYGDSAVTPRARQGSLGYALQNEIRTTLSRARHLGTTGDAIGAAGEVAKVDAFIEQNRDRLEAVARYTGTNEALRRSASEAEGLLSGAYMNATAGNDQQPLALMIDPETNVNTEAWRARRSRYGGVTGIVDEWNSAKDKDSQMIAGQVNYYAAQGPDTNVYDPGKPHSITAHERVVLLDNARDENHGAQAFGGAAQYLRATEHAVKAGGSLYGAELNMKGIQALLGNDASETNFNRALGVHTELFSDFQRNAAFPPVTGAQKGETLAPSVEAQEDFARSLDAVRLLADAYTGGPASQSDIITMSKALFNDAGFKRRLQEGRLNGFFNVSSEAQGQLIQGLAADALSRLFPTADRISAYASQARPMIVGLDAVEDFSKMIEKPGLGEGEDPKNATMIRHGEGDVLVEPMHRLKNIMSQLMPSMTRSGVFESKEEALVTMFSDPNRVDQMARMLREATGLEEVAAHALVDATAAQIHSGGVGGKIDYERLLKDATSTGLGEADFNGLSAADAQTYTDLSKKISLGTATQADEDQFKRLTMQSGGQDPDQKVTLLTGSAKPSTVLDVDKLITKYRDEFSVGYGIGDDQAQDIAVNFATHLRSMSLPENASPDDLVVALFAPDSNTKRVKDFKVAVDGEGNDVMFADIVDAAGRLGEGHSRALVAATVNYLRNPTPETAVAFQGMLKQVYNASHTVTGYRAEHVKEMLMLGTAQSFSFLEAKGQASWSVQEQQAYHRLRARIPRAIDKYFSEAQNVKEGEASEFRVLGSWAYTSGSDASNIDVLNQILIAVDPDSAKDLARIMVMTSDGTADQAALAEAQVDMDARARNIARARVQARKERNQQARSEENTVDWARFVSELVPDAAAFVTGAGSLAAAGKTALKQGAKATAKQAVKPAVSGTVQQIADGANATAEAVKSASRMRRLGVAVGHGAKKAGKATAWTTVNVAKRPGLTVSPIAASRAWGNYADNDATQQRSFEIDVNTRGFGATPDPTDLALEQAYTAEGLSAVDIGFRYVGAGASGATVGAAVGSFVPVAGTTVGAVVGAAIAVAAQAGVDLWAYLWRDSDTELAEAEELKIADALRGDLDGFVSSMSSAGLSRVSRDAITRIVDHADAAAARAGSMRERSQVYAKAFLQVHNYISGAARDVNTLLNSTADQLMVDYSTGEARLKGAVQAMATPQAGYSHSGVCADLKTATRVRNDINRCFSRQLGEAERRVIMQEVGRIGANAVGQLDGTDLLALQVKAAEYVDQRKKALSVGEYEGYANSLESDLHRYLTGAAKDVRTARVEATAREAQAKAQQDAYGEVAKQRALIDAGIKLSPTQQAELEAAKEDRRRRNHLVDFEKEQQIRAQYRDE